ncbi:MAG: class I tRNA ligase family protein, partial [Pseudomonadota bacterium]|nr:class I tRNA ligase family protein [Pseudomonadota bacterium]
VARMMMMGLHFMGDVPFREVYIHALVRDEKGQKMSKSKGNVIDPLGLIDKYGTDALRFTLTAMSAQGRDVKMSEKRVEGYRNFATKLWNAARYCQMNEARPDPCFYPAEAGLAVNRWIIGELVCTARAMDTAIEAYRFNEVADVIYRFVWGSFCDWYLEFTKPILTGGDEAAKTETRAVTAWVLDQMLTLLHPVMPFITEELYGALADRDERLLISADWPIYPDSLIDTVAADEMNWIVELVSAVRSLRADMNVPASAKIILLLKDADAFAAHRLARHKELILRLARLESADILDGPAPIGAALAVIRAATIVLPLADVIDLEQERARLVKEIGKIVKEIGKIDAKLANADFMNKAPAEVIDEQHKRLAIANSARDKLEGALASIGVAR